MRARTRVDACRCSRLRLPPGLASNPLPPAPQAATYVVRAGDTLFSIAPAITRAPPGWPRPMACQPGHDLRGQTLTIPAQAVPANNPAPAPTPTTPPVQVVETPGDMVYVVQPENAVPHRSALWGHGLGAGAIQPAR